MDLTALSSQVKHIWLRPWSFGKVLYLFTRYSPFVDLPLDLQCELWSCFQCHRTYRMLARFTPSMTTQVRLPSVYYDQDLICAQECYVNELLTSSKLNTP